MAVTEGALQEATKIPGELIMPNKSVESDHLEIIKVAQQLRAESDQKTASKAFDCVKGHLKYAGYVADDLGALYALKNKTGNLWRYSMHKNLNVVYYLL